MPKTYLHTKIGERIKGRPIDEIGGDWMERGSALEAEARDWLAFELGEEIREVGFLEGDGCGASPDGVTPGERGVELKCPSLKVHIGYILDNTTLLKKYEPQCQFGMWVSGWTSWTLAAYCPDMPGVIVDVKPSPEWHKAFDKVVPAFIKQVDEGVRKIQGLRFGEDELGRMAAEVFG